MSWLKNLVIILISLKLIGCGPSATVMPTSTRTPRPPISPPPPISTPKANAQAIIAATVNTQETITRQEADARIATALAVQGATMTASIVIAETSTAKAIVNVTVIPPTATATPMLAPTVTPTTDRYAYTYELLSGTRTISEDPLQNYHNALCNAFIIWDTEGMELALDKIMQIYQLQDLPSEKIRQQYQQTLDTSGKTPNYKNEQQEYTCTEGIDPPNFILDLCREITCLNDLSDLSEELLR